MVWGRRRNLVSILVAAVTDDRVRYEMTHSHRTPAPGSHGFDFKF